MLAPTKAKPSGTGIPIQSCIHFHRGITVVDLSLDRNDTRREGKSSVVHSFCTLFALNAFWDDGSVANRLGHERAMHVEGLNVEASDRKEGIPPVFL